jgi:hypothetical protein
MVAAMVIGEWARQHKALLTDVLQKELGFQRYVRSTAEISAEEQTGNTSSLPTGSIWRSFHYC